MADLGCFLGNVNVWVFRVHEESWSLTLAEIDFVLGSHVRLVRCSSGTFERLLN